MSVRDLVIKDPFNVIKFGGNPSIAKDAREEVWDYGGNKTWSTSETTYYISSSNAGDAQNVWVEGVRGTGEKPIHQGGIVKLSGQTKTEIPGNWLDCFRAYNASGTDFAGNVYVYEDDTVTDGVPQTATKVRAMVRIGKNQTLMTHYVIPDGYLGFITKAFPAVNSDPSAAVGSREVDWGFEVSYGWNKVFRTQTDLGVASTGTSSVPLIWDHEKNENFPSHDGMSPGTRIRVSGLAIGKAASFAMSYNILLEAQ